MDEVNSPPPEKKSKKGLFIIGGILVLVGFYNKSEVAGLISGKADSSVTTALTSRVASIESTTIPPISSAINNHLTAYGIYTGATDVRPFTFGVLANGIFSRVTACCMDLQTPPIFTGIRTRFKA